MPHKIIATVVMVFMCIFLQGCSLYWFKTPDYHYGLNKDGNCSAGCVKRYFEGYEGREDMAYCDCNKKYK
jgi:hypothetical protein